ncbi:MAG: type II toxin-antitoxin system HicA family toxin [Acidobacteriota bacterium]|nr:type II toxin-antitoxin system HicA family toxin [Acidobacteriota bacterium]
MSNLPSFDGRRLIKILKKFGFEVVRIKGSYHFLKHPDGRVTVVPVHGKENIGIGLFYKILKDCEITLKEFLEKG